MTLKHLQRKYIDHIITAQTVFDAGKFKQVYTAKPIPNANQILAGRTIIENSMDELDHRLKKSGATGS